MLIDEEEAVKKILSKIDDMRDFIRKLERNKVGKKYGMEKKEELVESLKNQICGMVDTIAILKECKEVKVIKKKKEQTQ